MPRVHARGSHPRSAHPQTASRFPFRWCGMKPTVSGISQLDAPPGLHSVQEEAVNTSEPRYANRQGYNDPIQSAYVRTGVNKIMTRFVQETLAMCATSRHP